VWPSLRADAGTATYQSRGVSQVPPNDQLVMSFRVNRQNANDQKTVA
jgi:hypothetical protein